MENTVTSDGEPMGAAGHGVKQNQRAHDNLRAGSYRGGQRRSGSRDGGGRISGRGGLDAAASCSVQMTRNLGQVSTGVAARALLVQRDGLQ